MGEHERNLYDLYAGMAMMGMLAGFDCCRPRFTDGAFHLTSNCLLCVEV